MAKGYDEDSDDYVAKYAKVTDTPNDTWAALVTHITGYPVPDRSTVFDTLRSDHGGKLFRMDIQERPLRLLVQESGFLMNKGEDYDIWFFDSGKPHSIRQARIVFEGRVKAGDEVIFASPDSDNVHDAQVREGNEFTDYNKDKMSTVALARYMNGPRAALLELLTGSTKDARFSDLGVPAANVVDLDSFDDTGRSFDFAAKFFTDHAGVLKDWEDRFAGDNASWKGEAAEVFRSLLKKIRENYDSYVETFNATSGTGDKAGTGNTVYSRALSLGRAYLEDSANKLLDAWLTWAKSPYYDPHEVLRYVLDELGRWVDRENIDKTEIQSSTYMYPAASTVITHRPKEGFKQAHPEYGDLTDIANWAKVGDAAVKLWFQGIDEYLGKPAAKVQSALNNHFLELGKDFSDNIPKPKSTSTASEGYTDKKLKDAQDEADRKAKEDKEYYEKLRAEDKAYAEKVRAEAEKQRAEDKAEADKLRAEQEKQRAEDKAYADKLRAEAEKQRAEDKAEADKLRAEQEKLRAEDKAYAEKLRAEQKAAADEAKRQADDQAKALGESLGNINGPGGPGGGKELNLGGLEALLNGNKPVTESLGGLGDLNSPGGPGSNGPGDVNSAVTETLGGLGDLNSPGGENGNQQGSTAPLPPITQTLGGLGALNNGPGGTNKAANDANPAITQNLGSLGDLNTSAGGSIDTPTGGSAYLDGGKLTSDFPDGSTSTVDPESGLVTTTHPDGSVTTRNLGDGTGVTNPDGSVTSLGDDGKLTTTFPDGSTQVVDPATGQAISTGPDGATVTQNLGSLGDLNTRAGGSIDTPTGGSAYLDGGKLTSDFPDGSTSTVDPESGLVTTTHPDGSVTTRNLGDGTGVTNPDGSVTSLGDDGKLTTTFPDGSTQVVDPTTGQAVSTGPDGATVTQNLGSLGDLNGQNGLGGPTDLGGLGDINAGLPTESIGDLGDLGSLHTNLSGLETPTGGRTALVNDDFATTFGDGSKGVFDPDIGTFTVTGPDGSTVTTDLTHGATVTNPDGSTTALDNGQLTHTFPDGSRQVIDPDTGIATVTDPQGKTETVNLHDLNSSGDTDSSSVLDGLGDLGDLGGLSGSGGLGGLSGSSGLGGLDATGGGTTATTREVPFSDLGVGGSQASTSALGGGLSEAGSLSPGGLGAADPLSDGVTGGTGTPLATSAQPGAPGAPGMPGSPGMPMGGGMGGMGAGGGDKGNGERVRAVLVDAAEESERRNRRRRSPWNRQEDSDTFLAPASRVATTGGDAPEEEAEPRRRSTSSADYLEGDADVWGTEEGGTPAVIGR